MSITMADDFDSDSGVGFKRRISDISDDSSDTQLPTTSFEESPPLSPPPSHQLQSLSPVIGKEGIGTVPHSSDCTNLQQSFNCLQKKPKCSNNQESVESDFTQGVVVKEKLGFDEDDSGYDDVPMNLLNDVDDVAGFSISVVQSPPLVDDGNQNNGCFSGKIEESPGGEVNMVNNNNNQVQMDYFAAVEDSSNKGLVAQESSSSSFVQNLVVSEIPFQNKKSENFFLVGNGNGQNEEESISDSNNNKSHMLESFADENLEGKQKKFVNENLGHNDSQRARGGRDVKCALKIQVIDDTALIGSVSAPPPGPRVVNNHMERNIGNNKKNNNNQETVVGYEKKHRRRGKGLKKCWETSGNDKVDFTHKMVDPQKGCEKKADDVQEEEQKKRWAYSRKEMEALRFVNVEQQKKKWVEIYCGFGPSVSKEYDGLVDCNHQKHIRVNFDPRPLLKKKDAGPPILSWVAAKERRKPFENLWVIEYCENMDNEIQNMDSVLDGNTVVQEELSEDDDSDDEEYSNIQRPAFLVTGKPDFDSGPPQDGLEYLRRVRWEAEHIPKVKVAKVERSKLNKEQTIYMPNIPDVAKCPDHLLPLKQWEDAFLADFSELRLASSRYEGSSTKVSAEPQSLPTLVHEQECLNLILDNIILEKFENLTTQEVDSSQSVDSSLQSSAVNEMDDSLSLSSPKSSIGDCGPTLTTILGMDSVARVSMLRKRISSVETMSCLSRSDCVWLFALCAAVDTPLNADTCASLRCLLRKCASLRAQKVEMDDEVVMLNILATISGKYFGQSEN